MSNSDEREESNETSKGSTSGETGKNPRKETSGADVSNVDNLGQSVVLESDAETAESSVFADQIQPGTVISRYCILKKIGEGGMGEVYLAQHVKFRKRLFAVKFLKRDLITAALKSRFEVEVNAMEALRHENIVFAHDAGDFDGASYLVMDYVDGISVKDYRPIKEGGEINQIAEIIRQAALGLQHAHEQSMVHRDIKPSNLMISVDGKVKILDMGLARFTDESAMQLTRTQQILGTPDYMAPEQWQDTKSVDIRADIYSLGCTLYWLLAGRAPYEDDEHSTLATKLSAHLKEPPPSIQFNSSDPRVEMLQTVLDRMLKKDPAERFQTPREVAEAVEAFCEEADLKLLTREVQPVEYDDVLTKSIQGSMEETHGPSKKGKADTEKATGTVEKISDARVALVFSGIALGVCLIIVLSLWILQWSGAWDARQVASDGNQESDSKQQRPTESQTKDRQKQGPSASVAEQNLQQPPSMNRTRPFSVTYIARTIPELGLGDEKQEPVDKGAIGDQAFTGRLGDGLKVRIDLPKEQYFFLIALNPAKDPRNRVQLCHPNSAEQVPERTSQIVYPADEKLFFGMTDGIGQQAFVLLTSDEPLPTFDEWRAKHLGAGFPWDVNDQSGVWITSDTGKVKRILERGGLGAFRGDIIEIKSPVLDRTVTFLQSKNVNVTVLAFPVIQD